MATAIQRHWDTRSQQGPLELSIASMEQVRSKVEARGLNFVSIGTWEGTEEEDYGTATR